MTNEERALEMAVGFYSRYPRDYNGGPYTTHLHDVHGILRLYLSSAYEDLFVAAYLHDMVEDAPETEKDEVFRLILFNFGDKVSGLVWAVTGVGHNRKTRNESAYAKIYLSPEAALLKLADRIANVEACKKSGDSRLAMYRKEHARFAAVIREATRWEHTSTADAMLLRIEFLRAPDMNEQEHRISPLPRIFPKSGVVRE